MVIFTVPQTGYNKTGTQGIGPHVSRSGNIILTEICCQGTDNSYRVETTGSVRYRMNEIVSVIRSGIRSIYGTNWF